ncbi:MAG: hypothetical protein JW731_09420 [Bacteroidales bacterium]|nr:hypothetical protein [Bacteroidales bacterium]
MMKILKVVVVLLLITSNLSAQSVVEAEKEGIDRTGSHSVAMSGEIVKNNGLLKAKDGGLLLIPDSGNDRVLAFDPATGELVDENFIVEGTVDFFSTPIQVLQSLDKTKLYISDQVEDVVLEFDSEGNYLGVFAPAGGPNTSICDNIRGIAFKNGTDHMIVCDGNHDALLEFDASGNYLGTFGQAGRMDPFDIDYWAVNDQYLVADIDGGDDSDTIMVIDNSGNVLTDLINSLDFPEQVSFASNGNILVATFTSPSGIYEFSPNGTQVGFYDVISACRGVYELPNGNLLITAGDGVYEISKNNTLVDTKYTESNSSFRFISYIAPAGVSVTFRVDMSQQIVSPDGVHIAGSFQGWDPGATEMTLEGDNIYTYTHVFNAGEYIEYKFVNGDEWGEDESVPGPCAQNNNRYLTVPSSNLVLPAVCFASCNPCGDPTEVTFKVDMSEQTVSPNGVHVAGSFQGWDPSSTEMTNIGDDVYEVTATVMEGETIEFKYINGNDWSGEEQVPSACGVPNGVGGYNRYYEVPVGGGVLEEVCFGSCYPCGFVPTEVDVTFRVDLSEQPVSPAGVHVAGSFQGWDPGASEMTLIGDDIYELTFTLWAGDHHQYKFINGITWDDVESVPEECGEDDGQGGYNRFIDVPYEDTTLVAVCFNSCEPCGVTPPERMVTFRVDMAEQTISPDGIHLAGSFQGWDPGATSMTVYQDDIYEVVVPLYEGYHYQYKFINGNTWDGEELVPSECGEDNGTGGYNRFIDVPEQDTVLTSVCFSSCFPCGSGPEEYSVTFRVDMAEQTISPDGIHLAGSFQGWDPEATPMTVYQDDIYEVILPLLEGFHYQYKFINGNTWDGEEIVPAECGEDNGSGGYNRFIDVPSQDTTLISVCFGSCSPCGITPPERMITFRVDMSDQTVTPDGVHLAGSFQGWDPGATGMILVEDNIYEVSLPLYETYHYQYKFINGNTWDGAEAVPEACGEDDGQGGYNRYIDVPDMDSTLLAVCFGSCDTCINTGHQDHFLFQAEEGLVRIEPNPFTSEFRINYVVMADAMINIEIIDLFGNRIVEPVREYKSKGSYTTEVKPDDWTNGIYFLIYRATGNNYSVHKTLKVIKK